jgi:aryl-alcohol dehydrogenase-like predicted oxidoreductase
MRGLSARLAPSSARWGRATGSSAATGGPSTKAPPLASWTRPVEMGVNFWDTAGVYGGGRSEMLIGRYLKAHPAQVFVATKLGRGGIYPNGYTRAAVRQAVEGSLCRLGVQTLDLMQLHCIPMAALQRGDVFDWLRELKQEGKIRSWGASVESMDEALVCLKQEGLPSLQVIFNIIRQKPIQALFPQAQAKGVAIITRVPLASGLLSGKFMASTHFGANDHRNYNHDGEAFNVGETFAGLPFEKGGQAGRWATAAGAGRADRGPDGAAMNPGP